VIQLRLPLLPSFQQIQTAGITVAMTSAALQAIDLVMVCLTIASK